MPVARSSEKKDEKIKKAGGRKRKRTLNVRHQLHVLALHRKNREGTR